MALGNDSKATYGPISTKDKATLNMKLPDGTKDVYLVVTACPRGEYEPYTFNPYSEEKPQAPRVYKYTYKII